LQDWIIAAQDGIDIVGIGPTDLSETPGILDPGDPRLKAKVNGIAQRIKKIGKAKLSIPMNHSALPLSPQDSMELGVGYSNVASAPPTLLI